MQTTFLSRLLPSLPAPDCFGTAPVYFALGLDNTFKPPKNDQKSCASIQSVVAHCNAVSARGWDAYMALGSFACPLQGRKQHNAHEYRCLWMDIDAGKPTSKYANAQEALAALTSFIKSTGLMPTYIVSSGMGLHVYWAFDKNVSVQIWQNFAGVMYQLALQEGLDLDSTRALDAASVLRLPGTVHQKSKNVVRIILDSNIIYDPKDMLTRLAAVLKTNAPAPVPVRKLAPVNSSLASIMGMGPTPPTANAENIAWNCPQMTTMGFGRYPQWFHALSVLRRCVNGLEWAHKLSSMDKSADENGPRYDYQHTERKFYDAAEDAPALCTTFERENPELCHKCKFRGTIKTPVQLSSVPIVTPAAAPVAHQSQLPPVVPSDSPLAVLTGHRVSLVIPDKWTYPRIPIQHPNFVVDHRGIVMKTTKKDPNGGLIVQEEVICTSQLYFLHGIYECDDNRPRRSYIFEVVHPNGKTEQLKFIVELDMGQQNVMRWFNNANMYATGPAYNGKVFMDFMTAYLGCATQTAQELSTFDEFGWQEFVDPVTKTKKNGFVVGHGIITDTGMHEVKYGNSAGPNAEAFSTKGELDKWKYVPQMYRVLDQKIGQLAICASFAAPLMKYGSGEAKNAILSIWSAASGLGKSQLLRACASVWGDPSKLFFSRQESPVARARRLAIWKNLPALMDEITDVKDEDMYGLAYTLTGGKEKNKLKSSGDAFVVTGNWSTCTLTTANKSFKEAIAKHAGDSEATLLRVMEYECEFPSYEHQPPVQQYINGCMKTCQDHYGIAGPEFLFQLLQHPERIDTLTAQAEHWCNVNNILNKERFMGQPLFVWLKAGRWAVEFGLLDFDMDALEAWVLQTFIPHNRNNTREWSPDFVATLSDYLNDRQQHFLITKEAVRSAADPDPMVDYIPDKYVVVKPMRDVFVRGDQKENILTIAKSDFDRWCKKRNISPLVAVKSLEQLGIKMTVAQRNLCKFVSYMAPTRIRCYILEDAAVTALGFDLGAAVPTTTQPVTDPVQNLLAGFKQ